MNLSVPGDAAPAKSIDTATKVDARPGHRVVAALIGERAKTGDQAKASQPAAGPKHAKPDKPVANAAKGLSDQGKKAVGGGLGKHAKPDR